MRSSLHMWCGCVATKPPACGHHITCNIPCYSPKVSTVCSWETLSSSFHSMWIVDTHSSLVLITVTTFASSQTLSEHPIQWKRLLQATAIALLREIPSYLVLRCGGFQIVEKAVAAMTLVIAAVAKEYSGHSHHPHACATFLSKLKNDSNAKRHDKYG